MRSKKSETNQERVVARKSKEGSILRRWCSTPSLDTDEADEVRTEKKPSS